MADMLVSVLIMLAVGIYESVCRMTRRLQMDSKKRHWPRFCRYLGGLVGRQSA
jgi:hypothetical protein